MKFAEKEDIENTEKAESEDGMTTGELIDEYGWPPSMWPEEYRPKDKRILILQEIRQEIADFEEEVYHEPNTDYKAYASVRYCLEIIDKHIKEYTE